MAPVRKNGINTINFIVFATKTCYDKGNTGGEYYERTKGTRRYAMWT